MINANVCHGKVGIETKMCPISYKNLGFIILGSCFILATVSHDAIRDERAEILFLNKEKPETNRANHKASVKRIQHYPTLSNTAINIIQQAL